MPSILNRLFCWLSLALAGTAWADVDLALGQAQRFFDAENYPAAITEYQRYLFFHPDPNDSMSSAVQYRLGLAYRNLGMWKEASTSLEASILTGPSEDIRDDRRLDLGVTLIASGNPAGAEFIFVKVALFSANPENQRRALLLKGICDLYLSKWEEAKKALKGYSSSRPDSSLSQEELDRLFYRFQKRKRRSPKLAKLISYIIPGSGQLYSGDPWDGLNALAINAGAGYLVIQDFLKGNVASVIVGSFLLFERFYSGNTHNAKKAAENFNQKRSREFAQQIMDLFRGDDKK